MRMNSIAKTMVISRRARWAHYALLAGVFLLAGAHAALADCPPLNTLPAAREGAMGYDRTTKCLYVCDGTQWVSQCGASLAPKAPAQSLIAAKQSLPACRS
jgi:hypothetical protein